MDDQNADANKSPQKDESPEEKASTAQSPSKLNLPLQMAVDEAGPSSTISPNADQGYHTQREGTDEAMETESAPFPAPTAESIFDNDLERLINCQKFEEAARRQSELAAEERNNRPTAHIDEELRQIFQDFHIWANENEELWGKDCWKQFAYHNQKRNRPPRGYGVETGAPPPPLPSRRRLSAFNQLPREPPRTEEERKAAEALKEAAEAQRKADEEEERAEAAAFLEEIESSVVVDPATIQRPITYERSNDCSPMFQYNFGVHKIYGFNVAGEPRLVFAHLKACVFPNYDDYGELLSQLHIELQFASDYQMQQLYIHGVWTPQFGVCKLISFSSAHLFVGEMATDGVRPLIGIGDLDHKMTPDRRNHIKHNRLELVCHVFGVRRVNFYFGLQNDPLCFECVTCSGLFAAQTFLTHCHFTRERAENITDWGFDPRNWTYYYSLREEDMYNRDRRLQLENMRLVVRDNCTRDTVYCIPWLRQMDYELIPKVRKAFYAFRNHHSQIMRNEGKPEQDIRDLDRRISSIFTDREPLLQFIAHTLNSMRAESYCYRHIAIGNDDLWMEQTKGVRRSPELPLHRWLQYDYEALHYLDRLCLALNIEVVDLHPKMEVIFHPAAWPPAVGDTEPPRPTYERVSVEQMQRLTDLPPNALVLDFIKKARQVLEETMTAQNFDYTNPVHCELFLTNTVYQLHEVQRLTQMRATEIRNQLSYLPGLQEELVQHVAAMSHQDKMNAVAAYARQVPSLCNYLTQLIDANKFDTTFTQGINPLQPVAGSGLKQGIFQFPNTGGFQVPSTDEFAGPSTSGTQRLSNPGPSTSGTQGSSNPGPSTSGTQRLSNPGPSTSGTPGSFSSRPSTSASSTPKKKKRDSNTSSFSGHQ